VIDSRTTRAFRAAFDALPTDAQMQARRACLLFRADPWHPSLRFKKVEGTENIYSIRIGLGYRALSIREESSVTWFWIGSHADYERLV
jgi:hypothetical protein